MRKLPFWITIGPRGFSEENLIKLINYAPEGIRINTSRVTYEWVYKTIHFLINNSYPSEQIYLDIGNNKPRIKFFNEDELSFNIDDILKISSNKKEFVSATVSSIKFFNTIAINDKVIFGDGVMEFIVTKIKDDILILKSISQGKLRNLTSLIIEGKDFSCFSIDETECVEVNKLLDIYKISLIISFIENVENIKWCEQKFKNAKVIMPKIETLQAIQNIDEILNYSRMLFIGRGDLALTNGIEKIGLIQRDILAKSNNTKTKIIIGTGTLDSLFYNDMPFRSEIIDITNSFLNGASGIMLTTETAASKTPFKSIDYLLKILNYLETEVNSDI